MLGWAHAAAAEKVLERADAELILSDQFSKSNHVKRQLKTIGRTKRFTQRTKAESDPAVAAASVVARATFLRCLERLGRDAGFTLPKGASSPVLQAAKRWVRQARTRSRLSRSSTSEPQRRQSEADATPALLSQLSFHSLVRDAVKR